MNEKGGASCWNYHPSNGPKWAKEYAMQAERTDEQGHRLVVNNGSLLVRELLTASGSIPVRQG